MNYKVRTQIVNDDGEVVAEQEMPFQLVAMGFGESGFGEIPYGGKEE